MTHYRSANRAEICSRRECLESMSRSPLTGFWALNVGSTMLMGVSDPALSPFLRSSTRSKLISRS